MLDKILFARHGETADNAINRLSTSPPGPPLNDNGVAQGRELAEMLASIDIVAVHTTPLVRAQQTAQMVAAERPGVPIVVDADLREFSVGEIEGRDYNEVFDQIDRTWHAWTVEGRLDAATAPGGETALQVLQRSIPAVQRMAQAYDGGTGLVVAHSGILQLLIPAICENLPYGYGYENWLRNCQIVAVAVHPNRYTCVDWAGVQPPDGPVAKDPLAVTAQ
ncbi:histidine phosphatase family protein [Micromonospora craniellae]|uniref:Histidine phosphatase family protein n=1 Tax=Micromonospora craniellae TaxID=2294034 RepID=A0A372FSH1_9ACTN|nr:histidine phosphatase family protein [Micromonospora craniellae]QOC93479.1 histidine phosphatase family protein [Micromonospora craniellae]RFS43470.1 histidine phosphatase family protein [Micromonospora craniellae]